MSFGSTNEASLDLRKNRHSRNSNTPDGFRSNPETSWILKKSRLSEEDLEEFRISILEKHKKLHYRVLFISALLLICIGIIAVYFVN